MEDDMFDIFIWMNALRNVLAKLLHFFCNSN